MHIVNSEVNRHHMIVSHDIIPRACGREKRFAWTMFSFETFKLKASLWYFNRKLLSVQMHSKRCIWTSLYEPRISHTNWDRREKNLNHQVLFVRSFWISKPFTLLINCEIWRAKSTDKAVLWHYREDLFLGKFLCAKRKDHFSPKLEF